MVVCKYFQQGFCRYGQNCRFDHIYGSKYTYHANQPAQSNVQPNPPASNNGVTDEQLVNQVQGDMQSALRGNQWLLSCYSPYKEKPIFPGINDLSFEEARLFIYEAKANNTVEQVVTHMNNLFKEARQKYEQLLQPNANIIKVLRSLYKGESPPSPFNNTAPNTFAGSSNASSIFRSAIHNAPSQNNVTPSIFSQQSNNTFNSQPDPAKSLFATANNNSVFSQNQTPSVFAPQNQQTAQSIFATAVKSNSIFSNSNQNTNPSSLFSSANQNLAKEQQNSSPFSQNNFPFNQSQPQTNIFQSNNNPSTGSSIFSIANANAVVNEVGVYSKMEDITETDLEAFKSNSFELGFIPEVPPPHELCVGGKGPF